MPQKVLISVAPVNAADRHIDPLAIAKDVIESAKLGAGQVHLHIRDKQGALFLPPPSQYNLPPKNDRSLVCDDTEAGNSLLSLHQTSS